MKLRLENKDCMQVMSEYPDNYFDLAVIDPPYGTKQIKNNLHGLINWNNEIPKKEYFDLLFLKSKNQIIWGANYFGLIGGYIVWNKLLTPIYEKTFSNCELAFCSLQNRVSIVNYQWSGNVQNGKMNTKNIGDDARIHPTQKPIFLYEWIFKTYGKKEFKILDTHLGSGSSLIAADKFGVAEFVGCEIDKEYYENLIKRYNQFKAQTVLSFDCA